MPHKFSKEARDFISKLLVKEPGRRLGAGPTGIEEIRRHPFFNVSITKEYTVFIGIMVSL